MANVTQEQKHATSRLVTGHAVRARLQMENVLRATDVEFLSASTVEQVEAFVEFLTALETEIEQAQATKRAQVKLARAEAAAAKADAKKPKRQTVDPATLTKKQLAEVYAKATGVPAPSKWNKGDLVKEVAKLAA